MSIVIKGETLYSLKDLLVSVQGAQNVKWVPLHSEGRLMCSATIAEHPVVVALTMGRDKSYLDATGYWSEGQYTHPAFNKGFKESVQKMYGPIEFLEW